MGPPSDKNLEFYLKNGPLNINTLKSFQIYQKYNIEDFIPEFDEKNTVVDLIK